MSTWREDNAHILAIRPYYGRPTWELKNIKKALSMMPWLNGPEEIKRLAEVTEELKQRGTK